MLPNSNVLQLAPDKLSVVEEHVFLEHGLGDIEKWSEQLNNIGTHQPVQEFGQKFFTETMFIGRNKVITFNK